MRNITKVFGAVAVAGVVAAGGSAFTATSTIDSNQKYVGATGQTVSGVHVTNVQYTVGALDTTTAVAFHVSEVLAGGDVVTATVSDGAGTPVTANATCGQTPGTSGGTDLACDFGAGVANVTSLSIVAS
jgi:hypothetical protein